MVVFFWHFHPRAEAVAVDSPATRCQGKEAPDIQIIFMFVLWVIQLLLLLFLGIEQNIQKDNCLLYTSDAADER